MRALGTAAAGALILGVLYWRIDVARMLDVFAAAHPLWLAAGFAFHVPMAALAAVRLKLMVHTGPGITVAEAARLNLAASALNAVLPSKMGDFAKTWFFQRRARLSGSQALALVLFERASDTLTLLACCAAGLALLPAREPLVDTLAGIVALGVASALTLLVSRSFARICFRALDRLAPERWRKRLANLEESWRAMQDYMFRTPVRTLLLAVFSLGIWFSNLFQVWLFLRALGVSAPLAAAFGLAPLAILIGLLPVTFAGVGTRDVAVVYFFRAYLDAPAGAALGVLLTVRNLLFGLAGWPFLGVVSQAPRDGRPAP